MIVLKNSTAIDRGAAPRSKSDELFKTIILVLEILPILCLKLPKKSDAHIRGATQQPLFFFFDFVISLDGVCLFINPSLSQLLS